MSYDDINGMRKKYIVEQIQQMVANEKITSELVIVENVNVNLESRIVNFEKLQTKAEQCNRRNNVEISGILNEIPGEDIENNVIEICKNSSIIRRAAYVEGCHRLSLGRNSTIDNKGVFVKFVLVN